MILAVEIEMVDLADLRERDRRDPEATRAGLTAGERAWCAGLGDPVPSIAARRAAKLALARALGRSPGDDGVLAEFEIERNEVGKPSVRLHGGAARAAADRGVRAVHVSLSHGRDHAVAAVVLEG